MKIMKITVLISTFIFLTACGTSNTVQTNSSIVESNTENRGKEWFQYELVIPMSEFYSPKSFEEIQKNSVAIVIAKTSEALTDRKTTIHNDETGHIESFYTDTTIEIIDILEQSNDSNLSKGDRVSYREYYALKKDADKEYILIYENYTPLKKGSEYILVMRKSEKIKGLYYNEAWNLAKFNIDGTDPYDFLYDSQQMNSLSSNISESLKEILQLDTIQETYNSYSSKKDGNSANSLNQLFSEKIKFYQDLEKSYSEKILNYSKAN